MSQRAELRGVKTGEDGFTIVEMLLALSLTALISALMAIALIQLRPIQVVTDATEADIELAAVGHYLDSLLSNTRRFVFLDANPDKRIIFSGTSDKVRFVSIARTGAARSSLREVEISARATEKGFDIIQANLPRRLFAGTQWEEFIVARDLQSVRFEYLDAGRDGQLAKWRTDWPDGQALPRAVRLTLTVVRFGRQATMEQVVVLPKG
ncbi:type II secretion system protein GspJ [Agrobacterium radiobacter]|uniref:Type II secretion system protein GspJ n=1 Tax=Agrobacterium radiobacter TaxID=362 RepID=A0ABD5LPJ6_AGRRD